MPALLASLLRQTYKDFEVIVSDGHSEDKTKEKALAFQSSLNLKFLESPKTKVTSQRNFGAKNASGEYLIFLDADYQADVDFLAVLSQTIASSKADIVIPISMPLTKSIFWKIYYAIANKGSFLTLIFKRPFVVASAICVKKEMFEKLGGYDDSIYIYEDQYLIQQLFKIGAKIVYTKARVHFLARRPERDGKVKFISQNIISTLYLIFKGPIKKKLFEYKMGGHEFKK